MTTAAEIAIAAAEEQVQDRREEENGRMHLLLVESGLASWFPETEWNIVARDREELVGRGRETIDFVIEPDDGSMRLGLISRQDRDRRRRVDVCLIDRPAINSNRNLFGSCIVRSLPDLGRILKARAERREELAGQRGQVKA